MNVNPTYRQILLWAVVLFPASVAFAYVEDSVFLAAGAVVIGLIVVAFDAARTMGSLDGIQMSVPDVVRFTRDREGGIPVEITLHDDLIREFFLQILTDATVEDREPVILVRLDPDVLKSRVEWFCTPRERGNIPLTRAVIGRVSLLGLWEHRRMVDLSGAVRVYPNIQKERKNLARIFLNRDPLGIHQQRSIGRGRDFAQLRDYLPGDSFEDIYWKGTARTGKPVTKLFQVERSQEVYVLIDSSVTSSHTIHDSDGNGKPLSNLERYINAALVLGLVAEKQGDLFGLVSFDENVQTFLKARNGKGHYNTCRDALYGIESSPMHADFAELFSYVRLNLRKRALLIILTDLSDPVQAEKFAQHIQIASRSHLILVNMIADAAIQPVFSSEPVSSTADIYQRIGGHIEWNKLQDLRHQLQLQNVALQRLEHESLSADLVHQYLTQKQRQLL